MTLASRPRRRRQQHAARSTPLQPPVGHEHFTYPASLALPAPTPVPASPPPPYEAVLNDLLPAPQAIPPHLTYQQPLQREQYLPPLPPKQVLKKKSYWVSALDLRCQSPAPARREQEQGWQSTAELPLRATAVQFNDCPIARSMNQGAALCDRVASRLNDLLCRLDREDTENQDVDALIQGLGLDDDNFEEQASAQQALESSRAPGQEAGNGIINFKKTWLYANSRLPPYMVPFKIYMPTWQILCRAADAAAAVYKRPQSNERQDYVDADWRHGTKAMALKSVCLDEKNLIVFAIRGSKWNLVDWAVNFRPAPKEPVGFLDDQGNACHAGFLHVARAMIRPVAARLRQLLEQDPSRAGSSLVITGHSAGGAVASLLYMHMLSTTVESELNILTGCFRRVHCVTFGAPPVSLLPLQIPAGDRNKKNLFISFANEGDPVVRADKQYIYSLGRLIAAPAPNIKPASTTQILKTKVSRQRLNDVVAPSTRHSTPAPTWPLPDATLSNPGRLVLLRKKPAQRKVTEAVCVTDEQLRDVIFGDPSMHDMVVYKQRIDDLAIAAVTGRDEG